MGLPFFAFYHQHVVTPTYWQLLSDEEKRRRDRRYPRKAVRVYKYSSFKYLYTSGNNQALLNATGFEHRSFEMLLTKFKKTYDNHMISLSTGRICKKQIDNDGLPRGKPRGLNAVGALGLVLMWYRTRGSCARALSLLFGQTSTPMYKWLKFSRKVLLHVLSRDLNAKVIPPTVDKIRFYQNIIGSKYPLCSDVYAAADGIKLLIQQSGDEQKQNRFYNGWKHGHYVNCIFVFCPDGKIVLCLLNAPGTFHDSTMADYGMYDRLQKIFTLCGGKVVVDSAFKMANADYLVKSQQADPRDRNLLLLNRQATSVRQLSEWGMRMVQGQFPRLKDSLLYEEKGDRQVILSLMVHLYNFHCSTVGINTIQNSYCDKTSFFGGGSIEDDANLML